MDFAPFTKSFPRRFESVQHVRNGPIREGRGHRKGNFYIVSVVVVVVFYLSLSLFLSFFFLFVVSQFSLSLSRFRKERGRVSLSLSSFYLRISDTRFLVVIKQIPGRNDDKSTFQDIKETLNNTVGSAAASAYQKITGNEYGKTLTESELAMQNAKKLQEHHRPPAPDWNQAKKDSAAGNGQTVDKDGKFLTVIGAMKSGGGYDTDPVQGDASLENKMKGLGVENPSEKKSFAWNDPPPPKKKEKKKKKKNSSDSDSSGSEEDSSDEEDEKEKEPVEDFGMDCEPKDKFRKKRLQKLKKEMHPILDAVRVDDPMELKALLELGGNANEVITEDRVKDEYDQLGWTPLLEAANKGRVDCMRALLKFKADPNVGCKENDEKPLHYAARGGHAQALTKLFKESKIDAFARNRKGATCLHSAAKKGRIESLQIILKQFRKIQEEMSSTADTQSSRFEDAIDFVDNSGQTALHVAAGAGYEDAVSVLVKAGADASLVDNKGRTPKKVASKKGYEDLSKVLRKAEKESESRKEKMGNMQIPGNAFANCEGKHTEVAFSPTYEKGEENEKLFKDAARIETAGGL